MAPIKFLLSLALAAASVSGEIYDTRFQNVTWDDNKWQITTTAFDQGKYQSRMSLANGYIGINVATTGPFFEVDHPLELNGWPMFDRRQTFATVAGFYDYQPTTQGTNFEWLNQYGGESTIAGVPHWAGLTVEVDGYTLNSSVPASQISDYSSTMDFARSVLTWQYKWTPSSKASFAVEYSMFVHKLYVNHAAVQLKLTASKASTVTVTDVLDGSCAVRTDFVAKKFEKDTATIWSAVRPNGIANVTAYIYSTLTADKAFDLSTRKEVTSQINSNSSSIGQSVTGKLSAGKTVSIQKFIGGASTDAFADPQSVAENASKCGADTGYSALLASHCEEWAGILTKDSVDDFHLTNGSLPDDTNILELQILAVTNPYHLLQNTVGENAIAAADNNDKLDVNSISVCGLGSSCYAGFIFWDAEVWMAPGLVVAHTQAAKQIANYRVEKFGQAQANVDMAFSSSQNKTGEFSPGGAVFPWTSGRFGNCTGTGPCFDYEYHINGDIGIELYNYYAASGDTDYFKNKLFPIYDAVAHFYAELLALNESTGLYVLTNATDPDEYANHVDNAGFTMALIKTHLQTANTFRSQFGLEVNQTWATIAEKVTIPVDEDADIILEYSSMDGSISVKQADVVLVDDLIEFPNQYSLSDLNYYASRQSQNGPGMTYGVFSVVANAFSPSGCSSYTYDIYGSQPYVRGPWFQFSEQLVDDFATNGGTFPAFPFLTGIGGANRVAVFGYLGLHLLTDSLNVNPNLPPQIPQLHYRTIYWQGHAIKAFSNQTHTTLTRSSAAITNANSKYNNAAIPVTIGIDRNTTLSLAPGATITIPNRQIGYNKTIPGNVAQCRPIASATESYVPGQMPIAAVDGSSSTTWQPATAADESWITVQLTPNETTGDWNFFPIKSFHFDWAAAPPERYSVVFSNVSLPPFTDADKYLIVNVTQSDNVTVSSPYDASKVTEIVQYVGNQTDVTLDKIAWSGRYVTLVIQGNQANSAANATGATVAEFAVVEESGEKLKMRELTDELLRAGEHASHQQL